MAGKVMLLVLGIIFVLGACGVQKETMVSSSDAAQGSIVQIVSGNMLGSGVIFSMDQEQVVIVTAAHVLDSAKDGVKITFVDGSVLSQEEEDALWQVRLSQTADIGFVSVPTKAIPEETLAVCRYVTVDKKAFDQLQPGDAILVLGSGEAVADKAYEGSLSEPWIYIEDYGQYMMLGRMDAQPGMSGGGVFDRYGRFIGILSGQDGKGNLAILPLSLILSEL